MTAESRIEPRLTIAPIAPAPRHNGMTAERFAEVLAYLERRKEDTEYFREWEQIAADYRRQQRQEAEREPAEDGK